MKRDFPALAVLVLIFASQCPGAPDEFRSVLGLNGEWEFYGQPGRALDAGAARTGTWTKVTVPHTMFGTPLAGAGVDCGWFRKTVVVPDLAKGRRAELCFHGIGPYTVLYVNGHRVGENSFLVVPWVTDITDRIKPGQANEIRVGIEGTALRGITDEKKLFTIPNAFMIGEANGSDVGGGIWYEVELQTHPAVYVKDAHVQTSFRKKKIILAMEIANGTDRAVELSVANEVLDHEKKVTLTLPAVPVTVPAGAVRTVREEKDWPDPRCWFPHDPYLYHLRSRLAVGGKAVDEKLTRFGFREYWIEKTAVKFNGVNAPVRRTTHGPCFMRMDRESVHNLLYEQRSWGVNNLRWHSSPVPEYLLDIADELGVLITQEGDMWLPYHYRLTDRFWAMFAESWARIARFSRNHPSVFSYSIANESVDQGNWALPGTPLAKGFKNTVKAIKRVDPTTMIEFAGGDDAWGLSPFRNWHYPSNVSARWCVPNDFYWLGSNPCAGSPERPGHRTKPVIVGEDLYDSFRGTIGSYAAFGGEDYYLSGPTYREGPVFTAVARLKTDAYRMIPIAVINPADPCIKPPSSRIFPPVALLAKDFRENFFAGAPVRLAFGLANEVWYGQKLKVHWRLSASDGKAAVQAGSFESDLPAGTITPIDLTFVAPTVSVPTPFNLEASVLAEGKVVDVYRRRVYVFPKKQLTAPGGVKVGVYDPSGKFPTLLRSLGLDCAGFTELSPKGLVGYSVLVLAPNLRRLPDLVLDRYLSDGGNVLALEQDRPGGVVPGRDVRLEGDGCTMAFPRRPDHPVLAGLSAAQLRWWGKDHWVARRTFVKPQLAGCRILVEAADATGLRLTPLMEQDVGRGRVIYCQLLAGTKLVEEPSARVLVQNALNYLASPRPAAVRAGWLAGPDGRVARTLAALSARMGRVEGDDLSRFDVVLVEADRLAGEVGRLKPFAQAGGTVWINGLLPGQEKWLEPLAGVKAKLRPVKPYQGVRVSDDPLASGIGQYDLWWRVGDWEVGNDGTRPVAPICTGVMEGLVPETVLVGVLDRWTTVTPEVVAGLRKTSAILAKIPVGKGRVIVDQVNWEDEKAFAVGFQYITSLLTNLRIEFNHRVPAVRSMTGLFFPLSLKGWINHTLRTDLSGTPGPLPEGVNNLAALPSGPSVPIGDVPFDIGGLVVLRSPTHAPSTPAKVTGLRVDRKVNKLHFLHGCAWCGEGKVFAYVIHRADGTTETVAVAGGKNVLDWWMASWPLPGATVAWQGKNEVHMPITLYRVEWKNPRPEVTVASIDVVGEDGEAIPFVVGITAETRK